MRRLSSTLLAALAALPLAAQEATAPDAGTDPLVVLHLGEDREIRGRILKETADAVHVDVGFDIVRVPLAAIVRRSRPSTGGTEVGRVVDRGLYRTAVLPETTVAAGSRRVGPAVVRIETPAGQGSGFLTSPDGHVVTNFHVVDGFREVDVKLYVRGDDSLTTRTLRNCKVLAQNPAIDLALVKITPPEDLSLPFVHLAEGSEVEVGQGVYAIGAPVGLDRTVTQGIVSVTNRSFGGHTMLQIDVPINPGNSGGPLFDLRGQVVGVNSAGYRGMQGLNFAIPAKYVVDFLRNHDAFAIDPARTDDGVHFLPAPRKPRAAAATDAAAGR